MKTDMATKKSIEKQWFLVDAENKVLGRLASEIAAVLRGIPVERDGALDLRSLGHYGFCPNSAILPSGTDNSILPIGLSFSKASSALLIEPGRGSSRVR